MSRALRDEIRQTRPFDSLEQEALLSIERTAAVLMHSFADSLKPHDIIPTEYNVLRILRGAGPAGLCRHEVRDQLVGVRAAVTRLLDRMEDAGLVARERVRRGRDLLPARSW